MRGQPMAEENEAASSSCCRVARKAASSLRNSTGSETNAGRRLRLPSRSLVRLRPSERAASSMTSTPLNPVVDASSANWRHDSLPPIGTLFIDRYMGLFFHDAGGTGARGLSAGLHFVRDVAYPEDSEGHQTSG